MTNFYYFKIFCFFFIYYYIIIEVKSCKFNKDIILERHNDFRLKHNTKELHWNNQLEEIAKKEAALLKANSDCVVISKQINTNYFSFLKNTEIEEAVNSWYEGIYDYDFELGPIKKNENVFEFTQLLWKSTKNVGCSASCCKNNGILICKYDNNANKPGYFSDNVGTIDTMFVFNDLKV